MFDLKYGSLMAALLVVAPSVAFATPPIQVPEPSSMALLAVGVAGAALGKFRKRK